MRKAILFIMLMCCGVAYPQHVEHIKEKHFEGYIFSKECSFCGFPPGDNRFTPSVEDVKIFVKTMWSVQWTKMVTELIQQLKFKMRL